MINCKEEISVSDYAEKAYLEYAMSVVKGRAIPSVQDGCKPVHRRIIYSMYKMGTTDVSVLKKCARVTGDVIGKYHPHGDVAVYETLVKQSQPFKMRYPIIFGEGNFGSRDGDGAAAQRYTECRFNPIYNTLCEELSDDAIDYIPNYDGNETEPKFLPAKLPFILLNGSEGIAVGMATNIPSHNIKEVLDAVIYMAENKSYTLENIMEYIKGPDFPTGAKIISNPKEIYNIYDTGKGGFKTRAKYVIENEGTKNWKIVFTELPYETSVKSIMEEIDDRFNPENKIKTVKTKQLKSKPIKVLTQEQSKIKQLYINAIYKYIDESDKSTPVRLVIEPKNHKQNVDDLIDLLFATTSLETTYSSNFVVVGLDGKPCQKNLITILKEWIEFRLDCIKRKFVFYIDKINKRLHILDGRKKAFANINEIIELIKKEVSPKETLMSKYDLSEIQAVDILELKLRQLNNLQIEDMENEYGKISVKKEEYEKIIGTEKNLKKQMVKELKIDLSKFEDSRRTEIILEESINKNFVQNKVIKIDEEDIVLGISEKNWIKVVKAIKTEVDLIFKEGDKLKYKFNCKNTDTLCLFDKEGKVYNYQLSQIGKDIVPINTLAEIENKLIIACPINEQYKYVLINNNGFGFVVGGDKLQTRVKMGKEMIKLNGGNLLQPLYFKKDENINENYVCLLTNENKLLIIKLSDISEINKGKGVVLCNVGESSIKDAVLIKEKKLSYKINDEVKEIKDKDFDKFFKNRGSKGYLIDNKGKQNEVFLIKE